METIAMPEVGTQVRARYIPAITDKDGKTLSLSNPNHDYRNQIVTVTRIAATNSDCIASTSFDVRDVLYANFTTPAGDQIEYYFPDWEIVDITSDTASGTTVVSEPELTPEQAEIKGLNDRISAMLSMQRRILSVMHEINGVANRNADDQSYCSQYEDVLGNLNDLIIREVPEWEFRFEGRRKTYNVRVERSRTIVEYVDIEVEGPAGASKYDLEDDAHEIASDSYDWQEVDEDVNETYISDFSLAD